MKNLFPYLFTKTKDNYDWPDFISACRFLKHYDKTQKQIALHSAKHTIKFFEDFGFSSEHHDMLEIIYSACLIHHAGNWFANYTELWNQLKFSPNREDTIFEFATAAILPDLNTTYKERAYAHLRTIDLLIGSRVIAASTQLATAMIAFPDKKEKDYLESLKIYASVFDHNTSISSNLEKIVKTRAV